MAQSQPIKADFKTHRVALSSGDELLRDAVRRVQTQCDLIVLLPTLEHKLELASTLCEQTRLIAALNARLCDLGGSDRLSSASLRKSSWFLWTGDGNSALDSYLHDASAFAARCSSMAESLDPILEAPTIAVYSELGAMVRRQCDALRNVPSLQATSQSVRDSDADPLPSADIAEHVNQLSPARDSRFRLVARVTRPTSFQSRDDETAETLYSGLMGLEVAAIEVCCSNIRQFPEMPWEFVMDMAKQISDEARHSYAHIRRMTELKTEIGRYPVDLVMWSIANALPLSLRLAIVERIGEWIGFEFGHAAADRHREAGDLRTAAMREFINAEEVTHVAIGNKWLKQICRTEDALANVHEQAVRIRHMFKLATSGPANSVDHVQAARAGFSEGERKRIDAQRGPRQGSSEAGT